MREVRVELDFHPLGKLDDTCTQVMSSDGQVKVTFNPDAGGQVLAFVQGGSIVSTNSFPKTKISQPFVYGGRKHFLDIIPTP